MFDFLVLAVLGLSTLFAAMRGGLRELTTLLSLAAAGFLALLLVEPLLGAIGKSDSFFAMIIVAALVIGLFFIAFHLLGHLTLKRFPLEGRASLADRIGGGVFGLGRGLVLIGLGYLAYGYYQGEARQPESVKSAMTQPLAAGMADWFMSFTPETAYLDANTADGEEAGAVDTDAAALGYERADRNGLEEVITTVTTTDQNGDAPPSDAIADILTEENQ